MDIKHLIKELKEFDENLEVITEGCDCVGDIGDIEINENGQVILLRPLEETWSVDNIDKKWEKEAKKIERKQNKKKKIEEKIQKHKKRIRTKFAKVGITVIN